MQAAHVSLYSREPCALDLTSGNGADPSEVADHCWIIALQDLVKANLFASRPPGKQITPETGFKSHTELEAIITEPFPG